MKKIFVLGTTEYAFMLSLMLEQEGQYFVIGHTCSESDLQKNAPISEKHGRMLYSFESLSDISNGEVRILNAVGYSSMNRTREKMTLEIKERGYSEVDFISNRAIVLSEISGTGNIVFPNAYIGTNIMMGNNNVVYAGATITHDVVVGNNNFIAAGATVGGMVSIANNCFLGMNATIKNRVNIASYSLIGAAAYVAVSTDENAVVVPSRSTVLEKNSFEIQV